MESHVIFGMDLKRKKKGRLMPKKRRRLRKYGVSYSIYCAQISSSNRDASNVGGVSVSPASSISDDFERFDFCDHLVSESSTSFESASSLSMFYDDDFSNRIDHDTPPYTPPGGEEGDDEYVMSQDIRRANIAWSSQPLKQWRPHVNKEVKKVTFCSPVATSHVFEESEEEADRKGCWEMYARDAERFRRRVLSISDVISPILECSHRKSIFELRFS